MYKDYTEKHTLEFDGTHKKPYMLNNKPVVGVTTFIESGYGKSESLYEWRTGMSLDDLTNKLYGYHEDSGGFLPDSDLLETITKEAKAAPSTKAQEAADIGKIVHGFAYGWEWGDRTLASTILESYRSHKDWKQINKAIEAFTTWHDKNNDLLLGGEMPIASPKYHYAGTLDRLVRRGNQLVVCDFKTSKGFYVSQALQLAAYSIAIQEWLGYNEFIALEILRFSKETGDFFPLLIDDPTEVMALQQGAMLCLEMHRFKKTWEFDQRFKRGTKNVKRVKTLTALGSDKESEQNSVEPENGGRSLL